MEVWRFKEGRVRRGDWKIERAVWRSPVPWAMRPVR